MFAATIEASNNIKEQEHACYSARPIFNKNAEEQVKTKIHESTYNTLTTLLSAISNFDDKHTTDIENLVDLTTKKTSKPEDVIPNDESYLTADNHQTKLLHWHY